MIWHNIHNEKAQERNKDKLIWKYIYGSSLFKLWNISKKREVSGQQAENVNM